MGATSPVPSESAASSQVRSLPLSPRLMMSVMSDPSLHCSAPVGFRPGGAHGSPAARSFLQCQGTITKLTIIWRPSSESVAGEVVRSSTYISMPMLHTYMHVPKHRRFVACMCRSASLAYAHGLLLVCCLTARPSSNHREAAARHRYTLRLIKVLLE